MSACTASLAGLNVELLALIFEYVGETSPNSIKAIAAVNHHFHSVSKLVIHQDKNVQFTYDHGFVNKQLEQWLSDQDILQGLRHLTVGGNMYQSQRPERNDEDTGEMRDFNDPVYKWGTLTRLIQSLGNLKTLTWIYPGHIPQVIVEALEKHQKAAKLMIADWHRNKSTADQNDPDEIALSKSPSLWAIKTEIWSGGGDRYPDLREAAFRRIVACAPKLKFASVSKGHSGCVIQAFGMDQMDRLRVMEDKFVTPGQVSTSLRALNLEGYGLSSYLLKDWSKTVDLSKLESLSSSRGSAYAEFFRDAPMLLPNLKHISLDLRHYNEDGLDVALETYFATCSPLNSICLRNWYQIVSLPKILDRHGHSLSRLELHEPESVSLEGGPRKGLLSVKDIRMIRDQCPNLRDFTMDLNRHRQKLSIKDDTQVLQLLTQMQLHKLQIYYDLGIKWLSNWNHKDEESDHIVPSTLEHIEPYVKDVWRVIFGDRTTGERALDVKFGEWERRMGSGYPAPWVIQEHSMRSFWQVRPEERDDRLDKCTVTKFGGDGNFG